MKHISSQYNKVCRSDGIINVHIAPFYSMYNHHHNYWEDWYHAYMLSREKKDSWGDSYRNFKNLPDDEEGFLIEAIRVDDNLVAVGNVSKQGVAISLCEGVHTITLCGRVHVKNHGISAYGYGSEKNWHRESFEVSAIVDVVDWEDSYMVLEIHFGERVNRRDKVQIATKKVVESTSYFKKFLVSYDFKQVTREYIESLAPGCRYLENNSEFIEPVFEEESESAPVVKTEKAKQETPKDNYDTIDRSCYEGMINIRDTLSEDGLLGGGSLLFDDMMGVYDIYECGDPQDENRLFASVNLYKEGNNKLYIYDKDGEVGPVLKFDNSGRFYFEFKDRRGLHQWFRISTTSTSIIISEVEDGVQTGKFLKFKEGNVYEGAYTQDGEKTEYVKYIGRKDFPQVKVPFPKMNNDYDVDVKKVDGAGLFCGNTSGGVAHGHGISYSDYSSSFGEFKGGEPSNFNVNHAKGIFFDFASYNCGQKDGLSFNYNERVDEAKIEVYKDGNAQEISIIIRKDCVIFVNNNYLYSQHYGVAKYPFRLTEFELKNGEWVEYAYGKRVCSLSGESKVLSTPRVKAKPVTSTPTPKKTTTKKTTPKKTTKKKEEPKKEEVLTSKIEEQSKKIEKPRKEERIEEVDTPTTFAFDVKQEELSDEICLQDFEVEQTYNYQTWEEGYIIKSVKNAREVMRVPSSVLSIDTKAFSSPSLVVTKKLIIPASVKSIGYKAFINLPNLEELVFEERELENRLNIGDDVICDCKIKHLTLPDGVWFINSTQFLNIKSLKTLSVGKNFFVNGDYEKDIKITKR